MVNGIFDGLQSADDTLIVRDLLFFVERDIEVDLPHYLACFSHVKVVTTRNYSPE